MSKKRKSRRDQAHRGPGARTEGATKSAAGLLEDAIKRELDPVAELTRKVERLGGRVIDPNGPEARRAFLDRHKEWKETMDELAPRIPPGASVAGINALVGMINLACAWAEQGRIDMGLALLSLAELAEPHKTSCATSVLNMFVSAAREARAD